MRCSAVEYSLTTKSLDVYLSGCSGEPKCSGCHNEKLWSFSVGNHISVAITQISNYISIFPDLIENIMIFGGEPLDQNVKELISFLQYLQTINKKIWLFTRYEKNEIPNEFLDEKILSYIDYIKTGRYDNTKLCDDNIHYGIKLASSNQKIEKLWDK